MSSVTGSSNFLILLTSFKVFDIAVPGTSTACPINIHFSFFDRNSIDFFNSLKYFIKTELSYLLQHEGILNGIYNKLNILNFFSQN